MKTGGVVPDFTLLTTDGESVNLYEKLRKSPVVLFFYLKAFTPLCTKEVCDFQSRLPEFESRGATLLGVSSDTGPAARQFKKTFGLGFPLLLDDGGKVRRSFAVPKLFGLMPGRATYVIGQDHRIAGFTYANGSSQVHVQESLQFLREQ